MSPISRAVSEKLWKWQYKLQHLGETGEKTLSDFSSSDSAIGGNDPKGLHGEKKKTKRKNGEPPQGLASSAAGSNNNGEHGATASVKTFYEGPDSREGVYRWVDYPPKQLRKSAAKAHNRVAIHVFKVKNTEKPVISGRFSLRHHMVEVQNPLLVAALAEILKEQDIHLDPGENASFKYPFQELYFSYDDIVAKHRALGDTDPSHPLKPFLRLFIALLDDIFADTRAKLKALQADGLVSFKLAWAFFPKNTTVISWGNNCELLSRVTGTTYQTLGSRAMGLTIQCEVLRFDGSNFLWDDYSISIPAFGGNRPITELAAYPLEFHDAAEDVRARLTSRGRKALDYQGLAYASYSGIAVDMQSGGKHNVDGRVLIDMAGYNRHHLAQGSRENNDPQTKKRRLVIDVDDDETTVDASTSAETTAATTGTRRVSPAAQERNKQILLAKDAEQPLLVFMLPLIEGYALTNKRWLSFFVEDIKPVAWNDQAYDHLVYDEQRKDLVMSFVESHSGIRSGTSGPGEQGPSKVMEDVIAGKGVCLTV
jgi:hypothetical protein